ncbi:hypothetical protein ACUH89_05330 [Dermabacteraceae bacterium P13264]
MTASNLKAKKPIYKRWWFIALVLFLFIGSCSSVINGEKSNEAGNSVSKSEVKEAGEAKKQAPSENGKAATAENKSDGANMPGCTLADPGLLESATLGLTVNDGADTLEQAKIKLTEGWVEKSDVNELWYVSAVVPGTGVTGVWVSGKPDGSSFMVSATNKTATVSNFPNGVKTPKFKDVTGEDKDIVKRVMKCARHGN